METYEDCRHYEDLLAGTGNGEAGIYDSYRDPACNEVMYKDQNFPQTRRPRAETGPNIRTQDKVRIHGRAPKTVYQSERVQAGPDLPPLPATPNSSLTHSQFAAVDPPVYDTIEDVETVLKVTEPFKKVHTCICIDVIINKSAYAEIMLELHNCNKIMHIYVYSTNILLISSIIETCEECHTEWP